MLRVQTFSEALIKSGAGKKFIDDEPGVRYGSQKRGNNKI
ncbi:hypothetical protein NIES4072_74250 [Nostoc commune NIES-4072]|uniref:Uncharacterized protein n=1 Tax=Nostoc commune NIES-4072 TaxID=2005467 RepID=A0A2R5G5J2_NOSCO|nr:hypothetical protein NIES4070_74240 [Nostoc commune HK-02]GBG23713.1 hypothetical protein NIES4072_74250 [Nostoc commune NIES-4072]